MVVDRQRTSAVRFSHAAILARLARPNSDELGILPRHRHAGCPASFADRRRCKAAISCRNWAFSAVSDSMCCACTTTWAVTCRTRDWRSANWLGTGAARQVRHFFLVVVGVPEPQALLLFRSEGFAPRRPVVQFLPDFIGDHGCLHRPEKRALPPHSNGRGDLPQAQPTSSSLDAPVFCPGTTGTFAAPLLAWPGRWSGGRRPLLTSRPLRTGQAGFLASGSSIGQRPSRQEDAVAPLALGPTWTLLRQSRLPEVQSRVAVAPAVVLAALPTSLQHCLTPVG